MLRGFFAAELPMLRLLVLLCLLLPPLAFADAPQTFSAAKKIAWRIYAERPNTFYCACAYNGNRVDLDSCGYTPRKQLRRAQRVEWEHVVPAWVIGHQRQCWQSGGRKNCARNDATFKAAEADLHNLVPSIGEVNGDRSNYALGMLGEQAPQYGACPMAVNFKAKTAMPPVNARGPSARIYLYMAGRYKLRLSKLDRRTYEAWNRQYPISEWERWRNQQVGCVMGHSNPFVGPLNPDNCTARQRG